MEISTLKYHCSKCGNEFTTKEAKQENDTLGLIVDIPGSSWPTKTKIIHLVCPSKDCNTIAASISAFGKSARNQE